MMLDVLLTKCIRHSERGQCELYIFAELELVSLLTKPFGTPDEVNLGAITSTKLRPMFDPP